MTRAQLRRHVIPIIIGIGIVAFALVFQLSDEEIIERLRNRMEWVAYDLRMQATLDRDSKPHESVVIIDIDEKSLANEGRWPWPREKIALLTEKLAAAGVAVTVYDIVFSEPQPNVALSMLEILQDADVDPIVNQTLVDVADQIDGDVIFATSLLGLTEPDADGIPALDVVLGYAFTDSEEQYGEISAPLVVPNIADLDNASILEQDGFIANLDIIQGVAPNGGFFNANPDEDGIIRRSNLVFKHNGKIYPSLSLAAVKAFLASEEVTIDTASINEVDVVENISLDGVLNIPTTAIGGVLIPFRGGAYNFTYISATDVLNDTADNAKLESTIALIGTSATGLGDLRPTPISNVYPGVEIHATITAGILDSMFPVEPEWANGANFILSVVIGVFLSLLLPFLNPLKAILVFITSMVGLVAFNFWLWVDYNFVVAVASPLAMIFLLSTTNLAYGFIFESQGKRALKDQFGQYVPPQLVDQMLDTEDDLGFEGDRREMTVLFADIRSFTTISESLSAAELKDMLNRFFTPMTEIIFNKQGTIDKYVGDMIMAFWGAPLRDPDHAKHAIDGALTMLDKVDAMQDEMNALGYPPLNIGVGLNTGEMNVGNMGSEFRRAYTVLGDAVNLSSRLEGLTKFYGVKLIVGENTHEGQDDYVFRKLDKVQVKGKTEPVIIYEPVCLKSEASEELLQSIDAYHQALALHYAKDWTASKTAFKALKEIDPDRLIYSLYLDRMTTTQEMLLTDDWDGTFVHTSK